MLLAAWGASEDLFAQFKDWKGSTISVDLQRRRPADVHLEGTRVCVKADATIRQARGLAGSVARMLESELFSRDSRLRLDCAAPQTIVTATITHVETDSKWGDARKVNVLFSKEDKWVRDQTISGRMTVTYQAQDTAGGRVLDSDVVEASHSSKHQDGEGAPTLGDVQQMMTHEIIGKITPRLAETSETVPVWLSRGKLSKISKKLGQRQAWSRMLEELEMMEPFPAPKDEAYRQYNIGVAYEALAYKAEGTEQTKEFLAKAAIHYGKAIDMHPPEKYFVGPQKRIEAAIVHYDRIDRMEGAESAPTDDGARSLGTESADSGDGEALTNQDIIDLKKVGSDDGGLLDMIRDAETVEFDLSSKGRMQLLRNGVSNEVIAAMRSRLQQEKGGQ